MPRRRSQAKARRGCEADKKLEAEGSRSCTIRLQASSIQANTLETMSLLLDATAGEFADAVASFQGHRSGAR